MGFESTDGELYRVAERSAYRHGGWGARVLERGMKGTIISHMHGEVDWSCMCA